MRYRYLFIGDSYNGSEGEAWQHGIDLLLCAYPALPLQFHLHNHARNTLGYLLQNCPRDILGKQAGSLYLCVGYQDLRSGLTPSLLCELHARLFHEISCNSQARLVPITLHMPGSAPAQAFNEYLRSQFQDKDLLDFAALCARYQKQQGARGEYQRNLLDAKGTLSHLGQMLFASALAQHAKPDGLTFTLAHP